MAALKRQSGDLDILDKQIALEQAINASAPVLGNKVTLRKDGPAIHAAMLVAISGAQDPINLESYTIEVDAIGHVFAQPLLKQRRREAGFPDQCLLCARPAINTGAH